MKSIIFNQHQVNHALKNEEGMFRVVVKSKYSASESAPFNVGETIFVKEAFNPKMEFEDELRNNLTCYNLAYKADFDKNDYSFCQWKPAHHMKQEQSRLTLRIKSVKVERLADISDEDCWKEGCEEFSDYQDVRKVCETAKQIGDSFEDPRPHFAVYWNSTHKKPEEKWEASPWVFAYSYEVIKK